MNEQMHKLFNWFLDNRDSLLVEEYLDKAVVIHDFSIVGVFEDEYLAANYAKREFDPGTFIVQLVGEDPRTYTATIGTVGLVG